MDLCEFEASLVYQARSKTARAVIQRNPVLGKRVFNNFELDVVVYTINPWRRGGKDWRSL